MLRHSFQSPRAKYQTEKNKFTCQRKTMREIKSVNVQIQLNCSRLFFLHHTMATKNDQFRWTKVGNESIWGLHRHCEPLKIRPALQSPRSFKPNQMPPLEQKEEEASPSPDTSQGGLHPAKSHLLPPDYRQPGAKSHLH